MLRLLDPGSMGTAAPAVAAAAGVVAVAVVGMDWAVPGVELGGGCKTDSG